jgi:hypothetical protein
MLDVRRPASHDGAGGRVRTSIVTVTLAGLTTAAGCREYHEPLPFDECQPYDLACPTCLFEQDLAETGLYRVWSCEDPVVGVLDVVQRRATQHAADDTRFYDAETGLRIGALRMYDELTDVCGRDLREEWYGTPVEDCEPLCEHRDDLPRADPELPRCGGIQ